MRIRAHPNRLAFSLAEVRAFHCVDVAAAGCGGAVLLTVYSTVGIEYYALECEKKRKRRKYYALKDSQIIAGVWCLAHIPDKEE